MGNKAVTAINETDAAKENDTDEPDLSSVRFKRETNKGEDNRTDEQKRLASGNSSSGASAKKQRSELSGEQKYSLRTVVEGKMLSTRGNPSTENDSRLADLFKVLRNYWTEVTEDKTAKKDQETLPDRAPEDKTEIEGGVMNDASDYRVVDDFEILEKHDTSCDSVDRQSTQKPSIEKENKLKMCLQKHRTEGVAKTKADEGIEEYLKPSCFEMGSELKPGGETVEEDFRESKNSETNDTNHTKIEMHTGKEKLGEGAGKQKEAETREDLDDEAANGSEMADKADKLESRWKLGKKLACAGGGPSSPVDFDSSDPPSCVARLLTPAPNTYAALNRKLKSGDRMWMTGFLEERGLDALLQSVNFISSRKIQLADAMMLLECVACVKTVMNSKIGLQVITERKEYAEILLAGNRISASSSSSSFSSDRKSVV